MKTVCIDAYTFDELSESAQRKAVVWFLSDYPDHGWWECVYEDARNVDIKITHFDCGRSWDIGVYVPDVDSTIELILKNHGESCDTYKTAAEYAESLKRASLEWSDTDEPFDESDEYEEITNDFIQQIGQCYLIMLRDELEYMTSEEHAREMIEENEYLFTENGNRSAIL